jgi:hypothetical protein
MFRFLKGIRGTREPAPGPGIDDLPAWIDGEEKKVKSGLVTLLAGHRPGVHDAMDRMEEVLDGFDTASAHEAPHPKLAGVAERSLPLFLKAIRMSLSRELPDDPEAFYAAAGEVLKGCLSAFRGQGRYLSSRFPEEMKVLRDGVDAIGRDMNAMTPGISRARERIRDLAALRESLGRYLDAGKRMSLLEDGIRSLGEEEEEARRSLEAVNRAIAELEQGEEFRAYRAELSRIRDLEEDRTAMAREYHSVTATALHLMKKGEKIASRNKDREAARVLREAVLLLEADPPVPEEIATRVLPPAQKALEAMISSGDLALKNREEIDFVEAPEGFVRRFTGLLQRLREISGSIASLQEALLARPAPLRSRELAKNREALGRLISQAGDKRELSCREVVDLGSRRERALEETRERFEALSGISLRGPEEDRS